jgi:hypothetical protein
MQESHGPSVEDRPPTVRPRGAVKLALAVRAHLGSRDVARVVYGAVIGLALVVALEHHGATAGQTAAALLGTAIAVGLAETYSEFVGIETRERRHVRRRELPGLAAEAGAVAFGAAFPGVFFLLSVLHVMSVGTAFTLAKWTGLGLIFAYGFAASRLAGSSVLTALAHAAAIGATGGVLIGLKALLH